VVYEMVEKMGFLVVICEEQDFKEVARVINKNGVKCWADRPFGNLHILHLTHAESKVTRVALNLIGLRNALPIRIEIIDKDGII
jgi:hypothetical protein